MEAIIIFLASVGGLAIIVGIICGIINLHDLFERVERLENNDDVRRNDIIDIRSQLVNIKKQNNK